jgi:hypothetical protein
MSIGPASLRSPSDQAQRQPSTATPATANGVSQNCLSSTDVKKSPVTAAVHSGSIELPGSTMT